MSTPKPARPTYRTFPVRVARVRPLTPHFVRVTLTGAELRDFAAAGLDQRIKIVLPIAGHGYTDIPEDADWFTAWRALPDELRNPIRTYTVRAFRPDACEIDIDFVDHGDIGPASRWVGRATSGDEIRIVGPTSADAAGGAVEFAPGTARRVLIAGDETAAPAICAILEALDAATVGHAFIEVPTDADRLPVIAPSGVEVTWIPRNGAEHGVHMTGHVQEWAGWRTGSRRPIRPGTASPRRAGAASPARSVPGSVAIVDDDIDIDVDAELLWDIPAGSDVDDTYAWIAGEAGCVKEIRRHLVRGVGMDRGSVAFMGYWRRGKAEC